MVKQIPLFRINCALIPALKIDQAVSATGVGADIPMLIFTDNITAGYPNTDGLVSLARDSNIHLLQFVHRFTGINGVFKLGRGFGCCRAFIS